jgi:hypothetical protein
MLCIKFNAHTFWSTAHFAEWSLLWTLLWTLLFMVCVNVPVCLNLKAKRPGGASVTQSQTILVVGRGQKEPGVHQIWCTRRLCIEFDAQDWYSFYTNSTGTSHKNVQPQTTHKMPRWDACHWPWLSLLLLNGSYQNSCFVLWIRTISLHSRHLRIQKEGFRFPFPSQNKPFMDGSFDGTRQQRRPSVILLLQRCNVDLFYSLNSLAASTVQP